MQKYIVLLVFVIFLSWCSSSQVRNSIEQADILIANHQFMDALNKIDQSLIEHPHQSTLLEKRAELLILSEQYDIYLEERPKLSRSLQKKLHRSYIIALMRTGEVPQALQYIDAWLADKPTSDWQQLKGQAHYLQGNIDEAIASYDEALRLDPEQQDALMNKAIALADAGSLYESLELLEQWIQKNPDDYLLRYNKWTVLSDLWYQQRNVAGTWSFSYYGDALRHFEKSYRLNPNYQNTAIWLWITYLDLSQYKKAHQALETVLSADPHAYDAWYYQAKTYAAEGNIDEAKKTYEHLLAINPSFDLAKQELVLLEQQPSLNE